MRGYKKKPYKIKPYKRYRRKPNKMKIFLIGLLSIMVAIVVLGYILPARDIVPWKPLKVKGSYVTGNHQKSMMVI